MKAQDERRPGRKCGPRCNDANLCMLSYEENVLLCREILIDQENKIVSSLHIYFFFIFYFFFFLLLLLLLLVVFFYIQH